jgi:mannose-6-phosphate isomerase-like protein (cupin superfamily)
MSAGRPVVVAPGAGDRSGSVERRLTFESGGERCAAGPGAFALVPPGVVHGFADAGAEEARMLDIHAPAGCGMRVEASG